MWVRKPCDIRPDTFCSSSHWKPCEIVTGITWPVGFNVRGVITRGTGLSALVVYNGSGRITKRLLSMLRFGTTVTKSLPEGKNEDGSVYSAIDASWVITWTLTAKVP